MWQSTIYRELNRRLDDVVGRDTAKEFAKLDIHSVDDLLRHVPRRYLAGSEMSDFSGLRVGDDAALVARVLNAKITGPDGQARVNATITDGHDHVDVTFFAPRDRPGRRGRNAGIAQWWVQVLMAGDRRGIFVGRVGQFNNRLQLTHPEFVMLDGTAVVNPKTEKEQARAAMSRTVQRASLVGLYPATSKLPTWVIADSVQMAMPAITGDTLPSWVVQEAGVLPFQEALTAVHEPTDRQQAEIGKERLKFDEAFGIQLAMAHRRAQYAGEPATPRPRRVGGLLDAFDARLPFTLTKGQTTIGELIFDELARPTPMNRLLQGEVGSGKTLVALRAMINVVDAGGQAVLLAPTEVLAKQHYATITGFMGDLGQGRSLGAHPDATGVVLLTGSRSTAAKRETLNAIITGEAGIIVGTHALLSDPVEFFDLGMVVIDEQQRFGVEQRAALAAKAEKRPHTLIMTATPIPRSIAMTVFGDLETSELRERPAGRAEVQTVFVDTKRNPSWVARAWERIREEVAAGRQAFIVCPAITAKETKGDEGLTAVEELLPLLASGPLEGLRLGMVHGKQHADERDAAMGAFSAGELDVLVATTVIEVGVDVPNATVMVIMDADRYGLSQLHQLRGRIGRGEHKGLCLLLAAVGDNADAHTRLTALATSNDGFELAELDLRIRREGDVLGSAQSGMGSLKLLRALDDAEVIQQAKGLAERVLADPRSATDPLLADLMAKAEEVAAAEWMEKT